MLQTNKKTKDKKENECEHIQDIPSKYFPRNNNSKKYRDELTRIIKGLVYTDTNVQYSSQICTFNIKSITQKSGFQPEPRDVFSEIEKFVYHYENYCFRAFCFREKLLQFLNGVLPVGYSERDVSIKMMVINPVVKQAKLLLTIEKFKNNKKLLKILEDRNQLTHKLYYGKDFDHYLRPKDKNKKNKDKADFKKWCNNWKKEVIERARLTNNFTQAIFAINHEIAPKVIKYKDSLK